MSDEQTFDLSPTTLFHGVAFGGKEDNIVYLARNDVRNEVVLRAVEEAIEREKMLFDKKESNKTVTYDDFRKDVCMITALSEVAPGALFEGTIDVSEKERIAAEVGPIDPGRGLIEIREFVLGKMKEDALRETNEQARLELEKYEAKRKKDEHDSFMDVMRTIDKKVLFEGTEDIARNEQRSVVLPRVPESISYVGDVDPVPEPPDQIRVYAGSKKVSDYVRLDDMPPDLARVVRNYLSFKRPIGSPFNPSPKERVRCMLDSTRELMARLVELDRKYSQDDPVAPITGGGLRDMIAALPREDASAVRLRTIVDALTDDDLQHVIDSEFRRFSGEEADHGK